MSDDYRKDQDGQPADGRGLSPVPAGGGPAANLPAVYDPRQAHDTREEILDPREIWRIVYKYRWTVVLCAGLAVLVALFSSLMMRPVYRASATIEITPNPNQVIRFDNVDASGPRGGHEYLKTEQNIIKSSSVGVAVVDRLELWKNPEIAGVLQQRTFISGLRDLRRTLFEPQRGPVMLPRTPENPDVRRRLARRYLGGYLFRLSVSYVPETYLFKISFDSFDPQLAEDVANAVTEEYIRLNDERRFASTDSARQFLNEEIDRAQARLESSERELYEFARRNDVVDVEDSNNVMSSRLTSLNGRLSQVRNDRIDLESLLLQVEETPREQLPQLLRDVVSSDAVIRYLELRDDYARLSQTFKPGYPRLRQLREEMTAIEDRQLSALQIKYNQLEQMERLLVVEIEELKTELFELQNRAVQYNILKRDWEANKELYAGLLDRLKNIGVAAGLEVNNVSVIERASRPGGPFKPNVQRNLIMGLALGLAGGVGLALLLGFLDNTLRTPEQLEQTLHLANLGLVPIAKDSNRPSSKTATWLRKRFKQHRRRGDSLDVRQLDLVSYFKRDSEVAEAYRSIRTSLMFSTPQGAPQALLVTSASSGEGKTTAAINLATVFAQNGENVLLIDADLRKPRIHQTFGVNLKPGLTEYLLREPQQQIAETALKRVSVMPAGTIPPNPVELLGSSTFDRLISQAKERYDRIIVDSPPVLGLADAVIAAAKLDGVLMVVSAGVVSRDAVRQSVKRLRAVYAPLVGCILNNVDHNSAEYAEYARYYYSYGVEDDEDEENIHPIRPGKKRRKLA